ncbi:MAG: hypothetical protein NTZ87_00270 [Candidatus Nomurabacteria bacterium]|nr:hypothetical protein [Candidatus Nomurabacteria bacterium]
MDKITIDENFIQTEAKTMLERKLTSDEYEEVYEAILEDLSELIQDNIYDVIDFNEMLERNKDADKTFPYYKTYHRNENAYQPKFKVVGVFKKEEDARKFINRDFITEFDEWRLALVSKDNTEQEVYKINC